MKRAINGRLRPFEVNACVQRVTFADRLTVATAVRHALELRALSAQPEIQSSPATCASMVKSVLYRPWLNHRLKCAISKCLRALIWASKTLVKAWIWWHVLFGEVDAPISLYKGLYQGLVFGWQSECYDPFKCEGQPASGVLGPIRDALAR